MKKLLLLFLGIIPFTSFGQTISVKPITFKCTLTSWEKNEEGVYVKTSVSRCVLNPKTLNSSVGEKIPLFYVEDECYPELNNKIVVCKVESYRKSNILGSEGKCVITPLYIDCGDYNLPLYPNSILLRGKNRTNLKFWLSPFILPIFIPGQGVKIDPSTKFELYLQTTI